MIPIAASILMLLDIKGNIQPVLRILYLNTGFCMVVILTGREKFVDRMSIAKDASLGAPIVTAIGNYELYVENFKSIVFYECDTIKLLTKQGMIIIKGNMLEIQHYDDEEIAIRGRICGIEY